MDNTYCTPTRSKSKSIPIYEAGHLVGSVRGDTFHKTIHGSKHIWRKIPSIGLSVESIRAAKDTGAVRVCIRDSETGRDYYASISTIEERGIHYTFPGYEPQLFLRLEQWGNRPVEVDPPVYQEALPLGI